MTDGVSCCPGDGDCCCKVHIRVIIVLSDLGSFPIIADIFTSMAVIICSTTVYIITGSGCCGVCGSACCSSLQNH